MLQAAGLLTAGAYIQHQATSLIGQLPTLRRSEDGSQVFKLTVRLLAASVPGLGEPRIASRQQPFIEARITGVEKVSEYAEYFGDAAEGLLQDCPWRFSDTFTFTIKVKDVDTGSGSLKLRMRIRRHAVYGCCNFELEPGEVGIGSAELRQRVLPSCVEEKLDWADTDPRWSSPPMILPLSHVRGGVCGDHIQPGAPAGHLTVIFTVDNHPEVILKAAKAEASNAPTLPISSIASSSAEAQRQAAKPITDMADKLGELVTPPDSHAAVARAERRAQAGKYHGLDNAPEPPDEDPNWVCRFGPNGQVYWHHKSLGPAPWEDKSPAAKDLQTRLAKKSGKQKSGGSDVFSAAFGALSR